MPRGYWSPFAKLALVVAILSTVLAVGIADWSVYLWTAAVYHCPADGCGDVPQHNCQAGVAFAEVGVPVAIGLVTFATVALIWRDRRFRQLPGGTFAGRS
jgi:hypothetical protein